MPDKLNFGEIGYQMLVVEDYGMLKIVITSGQEVGLFRMTDSETLVLLAFILEHWPELLKKVPARILEETK